MKYLVLADFSPSGNAPAEMKTFLNEMVIPTVSQLITLEQEKKISGGLPVGGRKFAFVYEADDHSDIDDLLRKLPLWTEMEWEVIPLQSFSMRLESDSIAA